MKFKVLNRDRVGKYNVDKKHIVISFRDPDLEKAAMPETDLRLDTLYLAFHDVDKKVDKGTCTRCNGTGVVPQGECYKCNGTSKDLKAFHKGSAKEIWEFVNKHIAEIEMIIVNCEAGISRSSGCAAALSNVLNGSDEMFFKHPLFHPNMLIYKLILNEGMKDK
jgi:predicted protein tyrosine phosphatase